MRKILLDARELAHPEPLAKAINILQNIDKESYLYMIHRKQPIPLISFAQRCNHQVLCYENGQNEWHILITSNHDIDLKEYLVV